MTADRVEQSVRLVLSSYDAARMERDKLNHTACMVLNHMRANGSIDRWDARADGGDMVVKYTLPAPLSWRTFRLPLDSLTRENFEVWAVMES